jgi:hypothetical protein
MPGVVASRFLSSPLWVLRTRIAVTAAAAAATAIVIATAAAAAAAAAAIAMGEFGCGHGRRLARLAAFLEKLDDRSTG